MSWLFKIAVIWDGCFKCYQIPLQGRDIDSFFTWLDWFLMNEVTLFLLQNLWHFRLYNWLSKLNDSVTCVTLAFHNRFSSEVCAEMLILALYRKGIMSRAKKLWKRLCESPARRDNFFVHAHTQEDFFFQLKDREGVLRVLAQRNIPGFKKCPFKAVLLMIEACR